MKKRIEKETGKICKLEYFEDENKHGQIKQDFMIKNLKLLNFKPFSIYKRA